VRENDLDKRKIPRGAPGLIQIFDFDLG